MPLSLFVLVYANSSNYGISANLNLFPFSLSLSVSFCFRYSLLHISSMAVAELISSIKLTTLLMAIPSILSSKKFVSFLIITSENIILKTTIMRQSMKISSSYLPKFEYTKPLMQQYRVRISGTYPIKERRLNTLNLPMFSSWNWKHSKLKRREKRIIFSL